MSDPPRGDNPPGAPPVDVPAAAPPDRAATEAARMEAERLRLVEAIVIIVINFAATRNESKARNNIE